MRLSTSKRSWRFARFSADGSVQKLGAIRLRWIGVGMLLEGIGRVVAGQEIPDVAEDPAGGRIVRQVGGDGIQYAVAAHARAGGRIVQIVDPGGFQQ